ncbi:MAG: acetolactate synthase large subunit, partial [Clostridia bacterium]|nr:acetolactate synthase large subunit [Clostridia bacterium]
NELATAVTYQLPLVIVIMNNRSLGMVREWQKAMFGRESQTLLKRKTDFTMLAKAFGADGAKASNMNELKNALDKAFSDKNKLTFVIDCDIMTDETVTQINR